MPGFDALYYPKFEPPEAWFRSHLLFFDSIKTIVPVDAGYNPSPNIAKIIDLIPESFEPLPPMQNDIQLDDLNLTRLRNAFSIIGKTNESSDIEITVEKDGSISINDHTFLHNEKISHEVLYLLREYGLIKEELSDLAEALGLPGYFVVNKNAGDLIVSSIADKVSGRSGWNTITDHQLDFSYYALNDFTFKRINNPRNTLACAIISTEIPAEIATLTPKKFKELREAYSQIREPFQHIILDMSNLKNLESIEDKQTLTAIINDITRDFNKEVQDFKKAKYIRDIKQWTLLGIGAMASLIGAIFNKTQISIATAAVGVTVQVVQTYLPAEPVSDKTIVKKLIGRIQNNILDTTEIRRLAALPYIDY